MAYDRYDNRMRRSSYQTGGRSSPRSYGRNDARDNELDYDRGDRDFFDRASDEVRSWFGDERAQRRRDIDERYEHDADRGRRTYASYERPYDRTIRPSDSRGFSRHYDRGDDRVDQYDYDRAYTQNRFGPPMTQGDFTGRRAYDDDYSMWRKRQIDELDRDYDEWRSENARRFDDEFTTWRGERMTKREKMRAIPKHAEVIGSDGHHVGTIDKVVGDRMILTRNDSEDGHHHSLSCRYLDEVEGQTVKLTLSAEDAKGQWRDEDRSRALGEDFEGDEGPGILNRSFSNTY